MSTDYSDLRDRYTQALDRVWDVHKHVAYVAGRTVAVVSHQILRIDDLIRECEGQGGDDFVAQMTVKLEAIRDSLAEALER